MRTFRRAIEARHIDVRHLLGFALLLLTIVPAYVTAAMRAADDVTRDALPTIESHIKEAARRYDVAEDLVVAVIEVESQFNPYAVSHRGAQGLMQLMPATAASLGVRDAFDPRDNVDGGVRHLRWLLDRFEDDLPTVLAAYNAGEGTVLKKRTMPRETREYVKRVMGRMNRNPAKS
jgi:soluble lytic murein transglycosylase-like protein